MVHDPLKMVGHDVMEPPGMQNQHQPGLCMPQHTLGIPDGVCVCALRALCVRVCDSKCRDHGSILPVDTFRMS